MTAIFSGARVPAYWSTAKQRWTRFAAPCTDRAKICASCVWLVPAVSARRVCCVKQCAAPAMPPSGNCRVILRRSTIWLKTEQSVVYVSDLIDLDAVALETTINFQRYLQQSLDSEGILFRRFQQAFLEFRSQLSYQSSYEQIQEALKRAQGAFILDYQDLAREHRIVIVLDTAEKFTRPYIDLD